MGLFVNQHQFFIDKGQLITEELAADPDTYVVVALILVKLANATSVAGIAWQIQIQNLRV